MAHRSKRGGIAEHLGTHSEAGEWHWIGKIPQPPADVLQAARNPPLRPACRPPLAMIGTVLGAPFLPLLPLLSLLARARDTGISTASRLCALSETYPLTRTRASTSPTAVSSTSSRSRTVTPTSTCPSPSAR
jgi:hypothetical protein